MIFGNSINARPADPKEGEQFHDLSTGKTYTAVADGLWEAPAPVVEASPEEAPKKKRRAKK